MAILLAPQLEALLRAIEEFDGDSATRRDLASIADEVAEELRQPVPDKSRILKRLSKIESIAGPAGAVDGATTALAALVEALL